MYAETFRPNGLEDVIGHTEAKESLKRYLTSKDYNKAILLSGPPGIGKTTLALAAAKSCGFDPLEINASKSIRSFEDVQKIKDACRSAVNIHAFIRGDTKTKTCVIFDEIDGSDSHAQLKVVEWIKDPTRKVPILCTGNELPTVFKRNSQHVELIRCFPPAQTEVKNLFPDRDVSELLKECKYDIRRMFHSIQYGKSDTLPLLSNPPTGLPVEFHFVLKQRMFDLPDALHEYRADILDSEHSEKANSGCKSDGKNDHIDESDKRQKKSDLDKQRTRRKGSQRPPETS
jgi:hypothetical protein